MKIAMIGSGAAGSVFAAYLRKGGAELWLVDKYKAHMDKIAADGLVFRTPEGEEVLTGFHTSATAHDIGTMDMVILMVKATQTADVMADTMPCIGPETVVVSLQNGLGNDEVLAQFVETDRILYGSGLIGTELAGPGVCVSKPEKGIQMHFGAVHNNPKADAAGKALEACFQAGGCNASFDEDVRPYIWKKVIANSGYNGVSAVMRLKVKETFADPYGHDIVMHVWKEGCAVAQALGIGDLWPLMEKEEPNIVANLGNYYPSMAQDAVLHQRQTEISVLNGAIARYGERLGVPTPFNTVITKVISCIQNNYDKQYLGLGGRVKAGMQPNKLYKKQISSVCFPAHGGDLCIFRRRSEITRDSRCAGSPQGLRQNKCPPAAPRTTVPFRSYAQEAPAAHCSNRSGCRECTARPDASETPST